MKKILIIFSVIIISIYLFTNFNIVFAENDSVGFGVGGDSSDISKSNLTDTSSGNSSSSSSSGTIPLPAKPSNLPQASLSGVVNLAIKIIFAVGEIGFVVVFLIAGVTFITAAGDEAKVGNAKKMLTWAIVGMVVLLSAYGIAQFIISSLSGSSGGASDTVSNITNSLGQ